MRAEYIQQGSTGVRKLASACATGIALWLTVAVLAAAQSSAAALKSINVADDSDKIEISLVLDHPVKFNSSVLMNPDRLYVYLFESELMYPALSKPDLDVPPPLERIRVTQRGKHVVRVVFNLNAPAAYSIEPVPDNPAQILLVIRRNGKRQPKLLAAIPSPKPREANRGVTISAAPPTPSSIPTTQELPSISLDRFPLASLPPPSLVPAATPPAASSAAPTRNSTLAADDRNLRIPRTARPPRLDDYLSRIPRNPGVRVSEFKQREPRDGSPASEETAAYLSFDEQNLYVAFVCRDDPKKVRGRMAKREDIGDDDAVSIYLDTFHDGLHAYKFSVNPVGIQADSLVAEASREDGRFDTMFRADARITDTGYVALFAIPFKSLRFSSQPVQTWGIALSRRIVRNAETSFWPYITRRRNTFIDQMAVAEGIANIPQGRNIRLAPYSTFSNSKLLDESVPRYQSKNEARAGLDSKIVLRDSLTLDTTINPDFSQVESDDPQVTVNQRYEVVFPEKRPFFLEGIKSFETPINLFFTRRIADPEFGTRFTGKIDHWNLGALAVDDRAPGEAAGSKSPLFGDRALIGAVRAQRDFANNSSIGFFASDREFGDSDNRMVSVDGRWKLSPRWYFSGQLAHSDDHSYDSQGHTAAPRQGTAALADLVYSDQHFSSFSEYGEVSPGFRAPLGYIQRTDIQKASQSFSYLFRPEGKKIYDFGPSVSLGADWDDTGQLQDWYSNVSFQMDFAGPVGFNIARYDTFERYLAQGFRYTMNSGGFYVNWLKKFSFYGNVSVGSGLNYTPADGVDPFKGSAKNDSAGFTWRPSQRLRLEESYYYSRLGAPKNLAGPSGHTAVFTDHQMRTKMNFQFTRELSLRAIVDYYGLLPNASLFNSDRYKSVTGDVLLTYLLHPGTALYLGYNNQRQNLALDPMAPPYLGRAGPPDYMTGRQFYFKISYMIPF